VAAPVPPPAPPSPIDSTFTGGVAQLLAANKAARDQLTAQGTQDDADLAQTLQRMGAARATDLTQANTGANDEGLFNSGQLGMRRGNIEHDYSDRTADAQGAVDTRAKARAAALADMGEYTADPNSPTGYTGTGRAGLDLNDLLNQAVQRRLTANQDGLDLGDPATGAAPPPPPPPAAVAAPPKVKPPLTGVPSISAAGSHAQKTTGKQKAAPKKKGK
jgi:hypothetical protein